MTELIPLVQSEYSSAVSTDHDRYVSIGRRLL